MDRIRDYWNRYREQIRYLIFGGLTTLVNIVSFDLLDRAGLTTDWANGLALAISIAFAYVTNRLWVFGSRTHGVAALKELGWFILCRLGTGLIDQGIMVWGVDGLGAQLIAEGGPIIFLGYTARELWARGVKVFSNIIVIVLNYIFSKLIIFRKKK